MTGRNPLGTAGLRYFAWRRLVLWLDQRRVPRVVHAWCVDRMYEAWARTVNGRGGDA